MGDTRRANHDWAVCGEDDGRASFDGAQLAVLMYIRDELQSLNRFLRCANLTQMALAAQRIDKRIAKRIPLRTRRAK